MSKSRHMTSFGAALVIICSLIATNTLVRSAGTWSRTTPSGSPTYPFNENIFSGPTPDIVARLVFAHPDSGTVRTTLADDRSVFPDSCVSLSTVNTFGWNKWKQNVLAETRVINNRQIQLTFRKQPGFSLQESEEIRCGPLSDAKGAKYYTGTLPAADEYFYFTINTVLNVPVVGDVSVTIYKDNLQNPLGSTNSRIHEKDIRNAGLLLFFVVNRDAWLFEKKDVLISTVSCGVVDCFRGILNTTRHFIFPPETPNYFILNISRTDARLFDVSEPAAGTKNQIRFSLAGAAGTGKDVTYKGTSNIAVRFPTIDIDNTLTTNVPLITMYNGTYTGSTLAAVVISPTPNNRLTITEDCIRGLAVPSVSAACPNALFFRVQLPTRRSFPTTPEFFNDVNARDDASRFALNSQYTNMSRIPWLQVVEVAVPVGSDGPEYMALRMNRIPTYETWGDDTISIQVPFSLFRNLEAPLTRLFGAGARGDYIVPAPIELVVTPTVGTVSAQIMNISEEDIETGGVVFYFILRGESWSDFALNNFLSFSSVGVRDRAYTGWNTRGASSGQECFLPRGAIRYNDTSPLGRDIPDISVMKLEFQPCPGFDTEFTDIINFTFPSTAVRSGMAPRQVGPLHFRLTKKPPGFDVFIDSSTITEVAIWNANLTFEIGLINDTWIDSADCFQRLPNAWRSNVPLSTLDSNAWSSPIRRAKIANATQSFQVLSRERLRFRSVADPDYDSRKGEIITITIPPECVVSGTTLVRSRNPNITIRPDIGITSLTLFTAGTDNDLKTQTCGEGALREAQVDIVFESKRDSFDPLAVDTIRSDIMAKFLAIDPEASGWNRNIQRLVKEIRVDLYRITIVLQRTKSYDIRRFETMQMVIPSYWMSSGYEPSPNVLRLRVNASAGTVTMTNWSGLATGGLVTEEDVRRGRLWFELSLVGDQFRREAGPFAQCFRSLATSATSFGALVQYALIPDISYFLFSQPEEGVDSVRIVLQPSTVLDIHETEDVHIVISPNAVESSIAPLFLELPSQDFAFLIQPVPGRIVISGSIFGLNEKTLRQSEGLFVYLKLFGEQWETNVTAASTSGTIFNGIRATPADPTAVSGVKGFSSLKSSIMPQDQIRVIDPTVVQIALRPNRNYEIPSDELILFEIPNVVYKSRLPPTNHTPLALRVAKTGGELRLARTFVVDEQQVREGNFSVTISVDGDNFDQQTLFADFKTFAQEGFGSLSSELAEPNGFYHFKSVMLGDPSTPEDRLPGVKLNFQSVPDYNIDEDETIYFTARAQHMVSRIQPDPATVAFVVKATSRTVVCLIDESVSVAKPFRFTEGAFASVMSNVLSLETTRMRTRVNTTAYLIGVGNGELVMLLTFLSSSKSGDRTISELTDTLFAIRPTYLFLQTGIRAMYYEDDAVGRASAFLALQPSATQAAARAVSRSTNEENQNSALVITIWVVASLAFFAFAAGMYTLCMMLQGANLSVSVQGRSKYANQDRYGARGEEYHVAGEAELRQKLEEMRTAKDVSALERLKMLRKRVDAIKASDAAAAAAEAEAAGEEIPAEAAAELNKSRLNEKALAQLRDASVRQEAANSHRNAAAGNTTTRLSDLKLGPPVKLRDYVRAKVQAETGVQLSAADVIHGSKAKAYDEGDIDDDLMQHSDAGGSVGRRSASAAGAGGLDGDASPLGLQSETAGALRKRANAGGADEARRKRRLDRMMDF